MKKLILVLWLMKAAISDFAQSYPPSIRQYISYDQDTIAFTHCFVADVIKLKVDSDQTVIIAHGIIKNIGDSKKIIISNEATIIDCTGKTLLPGFVLMHEHMFYPAASVSPYYIHFKQLPVTFPILYLACGATTIRTGGSIEPYSDLALKRDIDLKKIIGPYIEVTGPYMEGKHGFAPQMHELAGPEEAQAFVNFWASQGVSSFKAYMEIDKSTLKSAIQVAHGKGLKVTGHLCSITYREAAEIGIDQLEHGFLAATDFITGKKENECPLVSDPLAEVDPNAQSVKDLIQLLVTHHVIMTSTLAVFEGLTTEDLVLRPEVLEAMSPDTRDMYLNYYSKEKIPGFKNSFQKNLRMEKMFADAGGLLTVGTDPTGNGAVLAGYGSQRAIELLTLEGFSPIEVIRIATYNGAKALGLQDKIGSLEQGKMADLVVVDGNISQNIETIRAIKWVFRSGVGFDSKKLLSKVKGQVGKY